MSERQVSVSEEKRDTLWILKLIILTIRPYIRTVLFYTYLAKDSHDERI
jgi:hypothetical protein